MYRYINFLISVSFQLVRHSYFIYTWPHLHQSQHNTSSFSTKQTSLPLLCPASISSVQKSIIHGAGEGYLFPSKFFSIVFHRMHPHFWVLIFSFAEQQGWKSYFGACNQYLSTIWNSSYCCWFPPECHSAAWWWSWYLVQGHHWHCPKQSNVYVIPFIILHHIECTPAQRFLVPLSG